MNKTITKTYGVTTGYNKGKSRYYVVCDGNRTTLNYAKKDFALKVAKKFCKSVNKDFTMFDGSKVNFIFKQVLNNE